MKLHIALLLALSTPITLFAADDISSQMNSITESAFTEVSEQMTIQVNLSGKQRMLTQKMTKEVLLISLGINIEENKKNLEASMHLFDQILLGLKKGDDSLKLTKTSDTETLSQLDKVSTLWKTFKSNLNLFKIDNKNKQLLENITKENLPLLSTMDKAVSLYVANSGSDLNDLAIVINLSGKQRMLTQKMAKEFLLIAKGLNIPENQESLDITAKQFEMVLQGLKKGDKALALPETKDKNIQTQLKKVSQVWKKFYKVLDSSDKEEKVLQEVEKLSLVVLTEMNKAVKMYEKQPKSFSL
jgi:hypothetical protein